MTTQSEEMLKKAQEHWAVALDAAKQSVIDFFVLDDLLSTTRHSSSRRTYCS